MNKVKLLTVGCISGLCFGAHHASAQGGMQDVSAQNTIQNAIQDAVAHDAAQNSMHEVMQEAMQDAMQDAMQKEMQDAMQEAMQDAMQGAMHEAMQEAVRYASAQGVAVQDNDEQLVSAASVAQIETRQGCAYCPIVRGEIHGNILLELAKSYSGSKHYFEKQDDNGWTMLHWATEVVDNDNYDVVSSEYGFVDYDEQVYLSAKNYMHKLADPNITNNAGETALMRAVYNNNHKMVSIILGNESLMREDLYAGQGRDVFDVISGFRQFLPIEIGADPKIANNTGVTPLMYGARYADVDIVQDLWNSMADDNGDINATDNAGNSALFHTAPRFGNNSPLTSRASKTLIGYGADNFMINNADESVLEQAVNYNNGKLLFELLQLPDYRDRANLFNRQNNRQNTALMLAAQLGHDELVGLMISYGDGEPGVPGDEILDTNIINDRKRGAFMEAAYFGNTEIMRLIHESDSFNGDINLNFRDGDGTTPLMAAVARQHIETVQYLNDLNADPNIQQYYASTGSNKLGTGNTALMYALLNNDASSYQVLLNNAVVDVNLANADGNTALIIAASLGRVSMVRSLLARGANIAIRNNDDLGAMDYAKSQDTEEHRQIADILREHIDDSGA